MKGVLQQQGLVGLAHQIGDQQQIHQLPQKTEAESQQPDGATDRTAVVEALQATDPDQGNAPEQITDGDTAPFGSICHGGQGLGRWTGCHRT